MTKTKKVVLVLLSVTIVAAPAAALIIAVEGYVSAPKAVQGAYQHPMPLKLDDLTTAQKQVLLSVQDPNFYSHPGVDFDASGSGWTTITQGLVKQFYFQPFRPGFLRLGKVRQTLLAIGFNQRVTKDEQLHLFINRAYLGQLAGHEVYGFDDASHTYFGKAFADLSREEFVSLVAAIVSPATLNPVTHRKENLERAARIDRLMKGECARTGKGDVFYVACAK